MIKNGRRGSLSGTLTVKGIQCHIAYPQKGRNPIHRSRAGAGRTRGDTEWDQGNEYFPPTTWQISNIHGGTGATNVVPGSVEIKFNFRFSTCEHAGRPAAPPVRHSRPARLDYEIDWTLGARPFLTGRGPLAGAAAAAIRDTSAASRPSCRPPAAPPTAASSPKSAPQMLEIGPVNATSHKIDECIAVDALPKLSAIYTPHPRTIAERMSTAAKDRTDHRSRLHPLRRQPLHRRRLVLRPRQRQRLGRSVYLTLHTLNLPLDRLEPFLDARLLPHERDALLDIYRRRCEDRLPAAYLTHEAWLGEHRFYVDDRVIVPRSFIAELLDEQLAPWIDDPWAIESALDLCTGSGCLAILTALAFPNAEVAAVDLSPEALPSPSATLPTTASSDRIELIHSDAFKKLPASST
jgi:hypothetical protein